MIPFLSSLLVRLRQVQVFLRAFEWHQRRLRLGLGQQRGNRPRLLRQEGPGNFRVDQSARWLRPRPSRLRRDVLKNKKSVFGVVKHMRCCKQSFGYGSQKWALLFRAAETYEKIRIELRWWGNGHLNDTPFYIWSKNKCPNLFQGEEKSHLIKTPPKLFFWPTHRLMTKSSSDQNCFSSISGKLTWSTNYVYRLVNILYTKSRTMGGCLGVKNNLQWNFELQNKILLQKLCWCHLRSFII